ncbi:hypothetical protein DPMN_148478 [Dreissena polymorpha]|uniref:Uncharacterized protein n=1 Tax=Dreissena polymorpha TaxID=45954 RepID=A0A9D4FAY2_DREPO|nr:hypothetical protein DPMN_148478 [Dreissena polymorpha]
MVPENDSLMIEANESFIPTSISTGFNQSNAPADGSIKAGSESNEAELYYLASINQVYELMFNTLDEDFCPRPSLSLTGSAVTVTEQVARRREPGRISKATSEWIYAFLLALPQWLFSSHLNQPISLRHLHGKPLRS